MAYDESLAERVRKVLADVPGFAEKHMFGGVGYLLFGNMACGVNGSDLIVRVGPAAYDEALAKPEARPFDFSGRPMRGWVYVSPESVDSEDALEEWIEAGVSFALSLPRK